MDQHEKETGTGVAPNGSRTPSPPSVETLFHRALKLPTGEQDAYLAGECAGDQGQRAEVAALLRAHRDAPDGLLPTRAVLGTTAAHALAQLDADADAGHGEHAGEQIGSYRLLERIGEGGFGTVWMAEQREPLRRRVALKVIKLGMDTRSVVARFEQERQALAMMDHPSIARIFDAGASPSGRPFFAMELVRGRAITEYCDGQNLPTSARLKLFLEVCSAVGHAHQKGIIHRDLKPSNILVTLRDTEPLPKVIDFGVAKATGQERLTELTLFTRFDQMVGTPLYMAPEQAELSGTDIDTRCDIYALGVVLYELLAGRPPFDADALARSGPDEIRRVLREDEPPRPSTRITTLGAAALQEVARQRGSDGLRLRRALRGDLDWIVMKAMEKSRTRRYATANEFADDIRRHLQNEPVLARPPGRIYRLTRTVQRHRVGFAAAAAVLLVLLLSVAGVARQSARASREAESTLETLALLHASADGYLGDAARLADAGRFSEALAKVERARALRPDDPAVLLTRADLLQTLLRFKEAAAAYRQVAGIAPDHPRAGQQAALSTSLAAAAAEGSSPYELLRQLYEVAVAKDPLHAQARYFRRLLEEEASRLRDSWGARIRDFVPDAADRLTVTPEFGLALDLSAADTRRLDFLEGMPLEELILPEVPVESISPLQALPLKHLVLSVPPVSGGLSALGEIPTLEALRVTYQAVFRNVDLPLPQALRSHPGLRWIETTGATSRDGYESAEEFWERYDLDLKTAAILRTFLGPGSEQRRIRYSDWTWAVLSRGLPVDNLASLQGLPIARLDLLGTRVSDLSPLEGMPLIFLRLIGTDVTDLSPLADLPLQFLHLENCPPGIDLSPLAAIPSLQHLFLPPRPVGLEALRALPNLQYLSYQGYQIADDPVRAAPSRFWAGTQPLLEGGLVREGRYEEAEASLRGRIAQMDHRSDWMRLGAIQLARGDLQGYRDTCARFPSLQVRLHYPSETLVRLLVLSPASDVDSARLTEMLEAEGAYQRNPVRRCFYFLTAGLIAYRAGDHAEAVRLLEQVRSDRFLEVALSARAVLAMAQWKIGDPGAASRLLDGLMGEIDDSWNGVPPYSQYWLESIYAWLLAREAEALVAGGAPPGAPPAGEVDLEVRPR
ncbi:hypothetical protein BH23VER1_BH23VER1_24680 [soil metagenome]